MVVPRGTEASCNVKAFKVDLQAEYPETNGSGIVPSAYNRPASTKTLQKVKIAPPYEWNYQFSLKNASRLIELVPHSGTR